MTFTHAVAMTAVGVVGIIVAFWILSSLAGIILFFVKIAVIVALIAGGVLAGLPLPALAAGTRTASGRGRGGWTPAVRLAARSCAVRGGVAEWFRQGPAKPRTAVRFRPPPPGCSLFRG